MTADGFTAGFALATSIAIVAGFLGFLVRQWFHDITEPARRQEITHTTKETPEKVVRDARSARVRLILFGGALIVAMWFALAANDPAKAEMLLQLVIAVLLHLVNFLIAILQLVRQLLLSAQG